METEIKYIYRDKPLTTSFIDTDKSTSEEAFIKYVGTEGKWFADFLLAIKRDWIDKDFKVTDILIRENVPILIATVKTYTPFFKKDEKNPKKSVTVSPSKEDILNIVARFSNVPEEYKGANIDFSFFVLGVGSFRGNFSSDSIGCGISLRYLSMKIPTFDNIGYPSFYKKEIERMIEKVSTRTPYGVIKEGAIKQGGLILHVGATGSGKTTAIAAELGFFSENTRGTILTYEEPIEYRFLNTPSPLRQYEIGVDIKKTEGGTIAETIQKHVFRNNPSVVSFGEGRTKEDIRMMLETSLKGHLVMGTIHASNVADALTVLFSAVPGEAHTISNAIKAIVAHKLHVNKLGNIVAIFEIWIVSEQDKIHLQKEDIKKVTDLIYGEQGRVSNMNISFSKHIQELVDKNKLSPSEAGAMMEAMKKAKE